jgi:excisionase family DNA binding protein
MGGGGVMARGDTDLRDFIKPSDDEAREISILWHDLLQGHSQSANAGEDRDIDLILRMGEIRLTSEDGKSRILPPSVKRALLTALRTFAKGAGVAVVPADNDLTTGEAAQLLGISRTYLVELLKKGALPYKREDDRTHRRLRAEDVLAYKRKRQAERYEAIRRHDEDSERLKLP